MDVGKFRQLNLADIRTLSDEDFINAIYSRVLFTHLGRKRRFKYRTTNESVATWKRLIIRKDDRAILAVSGSGMLPFELLVSYRGAPPYIVAFDYSPKQVAYNYLLKSSIKKLTWKCFLRYFGYLRDTNTEVNRSLNKELVTDVPKQFRKYLPRRHHFGNRELTINSQNGLRWIADEASYLRVKKYIERIKFFEYEISHNNPTLLSTFSPKMFDVIYLSNILDWLCWHNRDIQSERPLEGLYKQFSTLLTKNGRIVFSHLLTRQNYVDQLIAKIGIVESVKVKTYRYHWLYCKTYGK